jgi:hypothetical protein
MELGERYLFAVDHAIDPDDQAALVTIIRREGTPFRGLYPEARPMWKWRGLAEPDPAAIPDGARAWFAAQERGGPSLARWGYYARLDRDLPWIWTDSEASPLVRRLLEPVLPLYRRLTKVNVVLQVPGEPVPSHRDLVYGNTYRLESPYHWRSGPSALVYEGEPWVPHTAPISSVSHEENGYLCLKIPLSERPDDAGNPYVELRGERHYYTSRNRFFFLNEVEMLHGAEPTSFWRGVVFVNGILDMDAVRHAPKRPVKILRTRALDASPAG